MMVLLNSILLFALAFLVTLAIYPKVLSFAIKKGIVDNPSARKLQRRPVPVLGGLAIYIGILVASLVTLALTGDGRVAWMLVFSVIMFLLGTRDDHKEISPSLRFIIECGLIWSIIVVYNAEVNDFHGVFGLNVVPKEWSIPLSVITGVGIINAINLIDGVDGYCSSYGVMVLVFFSVIFHIAGDIPMFYICLIVIAALLPFFFHNVFGKTSKMFLGDGGSLMLGTIIVILLFLILEKKSPCKVVDESGLSLASFTLAVLAIPVFDTLRVMSARMLTGYSPFRPDKTHLHHMFIEMNFSHVATSFLIITKNILIVLLDLLVWKMGASANIQLIVVILAGLLSTVGFYYFNKWQQRRNDGKGSRMYRIICVGARSTHFRSQKWWMCLTGIVDGKLLGGDVHDPERKVRIDPRIE